MRTWFSWWRVSGSMLIVPCSPCDASISGREGGREGGRREGGGPRCPPQPAASFSFPVFPPLFAHFRGVSCRCLAVACLSKSSTPPEEPYQKAEFKVTSLEPRLSPSLPPALPPPSHPEPPSLFLPSSEGGGRDRGKEGGREGGREEGKRGESR